MRKAILLPEHLLKLLLGGNEFLLILLPGLVLGELELILVEQLEFAVEFA